MQPPPVGNVPPTEGPNNRDPHADPRKTPLAQTQISDFLEPSGVLFEIATIGPGFAVDEDAAHLGERLSLPPPFEPMRAQLESSLRPLPYPPDWRVQAP